MRRCFRILSLDGGGIRGAFTARYLVEMERQVGRCLTDYFDLIVGTSTGGIIAIALGLGMSSQVILDMYRLQGPCVFQNSVWRRVRSFFRAKHDAFRLHDTLKGVFGDKKLGDSIVPLCIPVMDETNGRIKVLKTDHHPSLFTDYKIFAWEVAAATSAAPFYFESFLASGMKRLVDGGIWANNPSLIGLCEAMKMFDHKPSEVSILSIGTGQTHNGELQLKRSPVGVLRPRSVKRFVQLILTGQAQAVERMVEYLGPREYERIQPVLPQTIPMDDSGMIVYLEGLAEQTAQETLQRVVSKFCCSQTIPFIPEHKKKENNA